MYILILIIKVIAYGIGILGSIFLIFNVLQVYRMSKLHSSEQWDAKTVFWPRFVAIESVCVIIGLMPLFGWFRWWYLILPAAIYGLKSALWCVGPGNLSAYRGKKQKQSLSTGDSKKLEKLLLYSRNDEIRWDAAKRLASLHAVRALINGIRSKDINVKCITIATIRRHLGLQQHTAFLTHLIECLYHEDVQVRKSVMFLFSEADISKMETKDIMKIYKAVKKPAFLTQIFTEGDDWMQAQTAKTLVRFNNTQAADLALAIYHRQVRSPVPQRNPCLFDVIGLTLRRLLEEVPEKLSLNQLREIAGLQGGFFGNEFPGSRPGDRTYQRVSFQKEKSLAECEIKKRTLTRI